MDDSILNRLPAEIRDEIYKFALTIDRPTIRSERTARRCKQTYVLRTRHYHDTCDYHDPDELGGSVQYEHGPEECTGPWNNLALLRTCRQINQDAAKFVFCNDFRLDIIGSTYHRGHDEDTKYLKMTRVLVARFIAAIGGRIPKAIEIRSLRLWLSDHSPQSLKRKTLHSYGVVFRECPIRVRDPMSSLDELASQIKAGRRHLAPCPSYADSTLDSVQATEVCAILERVKKDIQSVLSQSRPATEVAWLRQPFEMGADGALFSWLNTHGITTTDRAEARPLLTKTDQRTQDLRLSTGVGALSSPHVIDVATEPAMTLQDTPPRPSRIGAHASPHKHMERYRSFWEQNAIELVDDDDLEDDATFAVNITGRMVDSRSPKRTGYEEVANSCAARARFI
ncbi:hypothetical protein LTR10_010537 [Elasticomyces elasticus]|nr:hypothetical protein LTR10_010537 [Elasticomyces elasticus]